MLPSKFTLQRIHLHCRRPQFDSWVRKIHRRRDRLPTPVFLGFPCGSAGKQSACNARDLGSIPGLGRSPGEGKDYPLQYSGLENSVDYVELDMTEQLSLSLQMCIIIRKDLYFFQIIFKFGGKEYTLSVLTEQCFHYNFHSIPFDQAKLCYQ